MKSGNLNFLESSGPVQACNGTALPLTFTATKLKHIIPHPLPAVSNTARPSLTLLQETYEPLHSARRVLRLKCSESTELNLRLQSSGMLRYVSQSVVRDVSVMSNAETS